MSHYVKCFYCGKTFDRDKFSAVLVKPRRYAHKECAENKQQNKEISTEKTQEEKDIEALEKYIMNLFNEDYVNARIKKQIKDFREEYNYTYSGMLKTLIYWYEVKGNSTEKANGGIGIIPFVYKDANRYYYNLYLAKIANENKDIQKYKPKEKIIEIASPRVLTKPPRLFIFGEDEDGKI